MTIKPHSKNPKTKMTAPHWDWCGLSDRWIAMPFMVRAMRPKARITPPATWIMIIGLCMGKNMRTPARPVNPPIHAGSA